MSSIAETFPLIRVVNLPERTDRLRDMSAELRALGAPFPPGHVEVFAAVRPTELAGFPSLGAHGCFMSHLSILRDAQARNVSSVLVLEDDLEVLPADIARLNALLGRLPEDWAMLYPGHVEPVPLDGEPHWMPFAGPLGTSHCYAVHRSALPRLIAYLEACLVRPPGDPAGGPMHYDGALTMFRAQNPALKTYIAVPNLGRQRSSRSDITTRRLDQVPLLRDAISFARQVRRSLRR